MTSWRFCPARTLVSCVPSRTLSFLQPESPTEGPHASHETRGGSALTAFGTTKPQPLPHSSQSTYCASSSAQVGARGPASAVADALAGALAAAVPDGAPEP